MEGELNVRQRIAKIEENQKKLAEGLKRVAKIIGDEWGDEVVEPGEIICGIEF